METSYYDSGAIRTQCWSEMETWTTHYESGAIKTQSWPKLHISYYESGEKETMRRILDDSGLDYEETTYYPTGVIKKHVHHVNGWTVSKTEYYESGAVRTQERQDLGVTESLEVISYDESGAIRV